ncbi:hypothetical protein MMC09_002131 [Bachmanniomyces sp. S44760]|nr:hypothetical protein [Bachmanniomyces sp. S44760]
MRQYCLTTIIALSGLFQLSHSSITKPRTSHELEHRDLTVADCTNPNKNSNSACYDVLNVTGYLQDWWQQSGPDCQQNYASDGFASCYQQKVGKGALLNQRCDTTGSSQCFPPSNFSQYTPQEFYVLTSIFEVWKWFDTIYYASDFGDTTAGQRVGNITQTFNALKPQKTDMTIGIILAVLTAALAFLDFPAAAAVGGAETAIEKAAQSSSTAATINAPSKASTAGVGSGLSTALQQAPGVAKALIPPAGTIESQSLQVYEIEAQLGTVVQAFQANIANALKALQDNVTEFMVFASEGKFISPDANLNISTSALTQTLTTYVVSESMKANGWSVHYSPDTNPYEMRNNGSLPSKYNDYVNCQDPPDSYGVCDKWFYDGKDSYMIWKDSGDQSVQADPYQLMETMFSLGWTSGNLLFNDALSCWGQVIRTGATTATPSVDPTTLSSNCISSVNVALWRSYTDCNAAHMPNGCDGVTNGWAPGTSCFWGMYGDGCKEDSFDPSVHPGGASFTGMDPTSLYLKSQGVV